MVQDEPNFQIHIAVVLLINLIGLWLRFTIFQWVAIWICIGLVLITEIMNTAIEQLCNSITTEKNASIGKVKDLSAAAALVAALVSVIVAIFVIVDSCYNGPLTLLR